MGDRTKIEWADASWNPIRARLKEQMAVIGSHCEIITPGCQNCYAMAINKRLGTGLSYHAYQREKVEIFLDEKILMQPLHWKRPRRIFPGSTTDLFGEWVTDEMLDKIFAVMALCPQHTFLPLTKRVDRMRDYLSCPPATKRAAGYGEWLHERRDEIAQVAFELRDDLSEGRRRLAFSDEECCIQTERWPLPNVWCGASVEDQRRADERMPILFQTPAAVRWISLEPQLEHVEPSLSWGGKRIDWVVVGGESGLGARPFNIGWARAIITQCREAEVACFVKQVGARPYYGTPECGPKLCDRKGGDISEWPVDIRVREYPQ
jgi:protein gp37